MKRPRWMSRGAWFALPRRTRRTIAHPRPLTLQAVDDNLRSIYSERAVGRMAQGPGMYWARWRAADASARVRAVAP